MKTRDRIILASLDLFNEQGERNVSTNHIAAHLGMSPGNLYYHFRNKNDIIYEIFKNYELMVDTYLQVPENRAIQVHDLIAYLDAVFNGLWAYRFLHRDLEHLLVSDERLRRDYRQFTLRCLDAIRRIIKAMIKSEIYRPIDDNKLQSKALNVWLIVTNWMTFLKTVHDDEGANAVNRDAIKHGVYLILDYVLPYMYEERMATVMELQQSYCFDNIMPSPQTPE
ncbi:MAG: TetR/AcrR family transcriptional regulator [Oleiphilaceae bacterium]|nr:TetR/AcrR family transcriptional regulator [Oleiphilaceae bacterium]